MLVIEWDSRRRSPPHWCVGAKREIFLQPAVAAGRTRPRLDRQRDARDAKIAADDELAVASDEVAMQARHQPANIRAAQRDGVGREEPLIQEPDIAGDVDVNPVVWMTRLDGRLDRLHDPLAGESDPERRDHVECGQVGDGDARQGRDDDRRRRGVAGPGRDLGEAGDLSTGDGRREDWHLTPAAGQHDRRGRRVARAALRRR